MEDTRGMMDMREHRAMWAAFTTIVKSGLGFVVILLILMAIFLL